MKNLKSPKFITIRLFIISFIVLSLYSYPSLNADVLSDPKVTIYEDNVEYTGRGDISSLSILTNNSHIKFQVNYEEEIINSTDYLRLGDIFIDVDRNKSTGYRKYGMGADYRVDIDVYGMGIRGLADVAYWNSTLFAFIEVYPVKMETQGNNILLHVPLDQIGIDNETSIGIRAAFRTRIIDRGSILFAYNWNNQHNITLDGNYDDWVEISPVFTDPVENYEEQSDFTNFYMGHNDTHLFHRFDVKGVMPYVTPSDITLGGELRIYYDVDNNTETGSYRSGIGADYYHWVKTQRNSTGAQTHTYGYLHKWNNSKQTWDWPNKKILLDSVYINSTFEYVIPTSEDYLNISNSPIRLVIEQYNSEIYDDLPKEGYVSYVPPFIEVIESKVSKVRADVDSTQKVHFRVQLSNGNNVTTGRLYVNDTETEVNSTGWATIEVSSIEVKKDSWTITGVNALDVRMFNQTISSPSIIWDLVQISVPEDERVNIGEELSNEYAHYVFDGEPFEGRIILNDTLTDKQVGRYEFKVIGLEDYNHNLSKFEPDHFNLIFDKVNIVMSLVDTRLDIGTLPVLNITSSYMYNSEPFEGNITVVTTLNVFSVKEHTYYVSEVSDEYGINKFNSNNITCVWDQVIITDAGVSNTESEVGETEEVWFKAEYAYDNDAFDPDDGVLYVDWEQCKWDDEYKRWTKSVTSDIDGIKVYFVTKIEDTKYDLTMFHQEVDDVSVNWTKKPWQIPGFPYISIIIGLMIATLFNYFKKK